jgi:Predicted Zn-dependent proteases and their inactivated homologs
MEVLEKIINYGIKLGSNFVEARFERNSNLTITYVDGKPRNIKQGSDKGISIRIYYKGAWGFSAINNENEEAIEKAISNAFKMAKIASEKIVSFKEIRIPKVYSVKSEIKQRVPFDNVSLEDKLEIVKKICDDIEEVKEIKSSTVNYSENVDEKSIANSYGLHVEKIEPYLHLSSIAIGYEEGKRSRGYEAIGSTGGFEIIEEKKGIEIGKKVSEKAKMLLEAKGIKPGVYDCIIDPILAGVFAHEGIGHPSEADAIVENNSILKDMLNKKIASELVTIKDNPLIKGTYGNYEYDDEGIIAREKVIIEKGILKEYLNNIETAIILNHQLNGSSRASSYFNEPIVRMSNIYFEKGDLSFEELVENTKNGLYLKGFVYGYVTPNNGQYTFKCEYGYVIEKGEIKYPIREVSTSGQILETLLKVDAVGKDLKIEGVGHCGKEGQYVRVGDGGPHLRIRKLVVGAVE